MWPNEIHHRREQDRREQDYMGIVKGGAGRKKFARIRSLEQRRDKQRGVRGRRSNLINPLRKYTGDRTTLTIWLYGGRVPFSSPLPLHEDTHQTTSDWWVFFFVYYSNEMNINFCPICSVLFHHLIYIRGHRTFSNETGGNPYIWLLKSRVLLTLWKK